MKLGKKIHQGKGQRLFLMAKWWHLADWCYISRDISLGAVSLAYWEWKQNNSIQITIVLVPE